MEETKENVAGGEKARVLFNVQVGLRQSCVTPPSDFNLYVNGVIEEIWEGAVL